MLMKDIKTQSRKAAKPGEYSYSGPNCLDNMTISSLNKRKINKSSYRQLFEEISKDEELKKQE